MKKEYKKMFISVNKRSTTFYDIVFAPDSEGGDYRGLNECNSEGELEALAKTKNPLLDAEKLTRLVQRYKQLPSVCAQLPIDKIIHWKDPSLSKKRYLLIMLTCARLAPTLFC